MHQEEVVLLSSTYFLTVKCLKCLSGLAQTYLLITINVTSVMMFVTVVYGAIVQQYGRRADCWLPERDWGSTHVFRRPSD